MFPRIFSVRIASEMLFDSLNGVTSVPCRSVGMCQIIEAKGMPFERRNAAWPILSLISNG
jgi:hypothetical protein